MKIKHLAIVAALAIATTACDNNKKPEQAAEPVQQHDDGCCDNNGQKTTCKTVKCYFLLFHAAKIVQKFDINDEN